MAVACSPTKEQLQCVIIVRQQSFIDTPGAERLEHCVDERQRPRRHSGGGRGRPDHGTMFGSDKQLILSIPSLHTRVCPEAPRI